MNCPRCSGEALKPVELLGGIEVDACDKCNGMYFEKGEMGAYLKFSKDVPNYKDLLKNAPVGVTCPECSAQMKELKYIPGKDLLVDYCETCGGVWLDGGEIQEAEAIADAQDDRKIRLMRAIWQMRAEVRGENILKCPKCKTPTVHEFYTGEGVTLDLCDRCKGSWFEKGELADACELAEDIPDLQVALSTAKPTDYICPHCKGEKLVELEYSQIATASGKLLVDYCKKCQGIWVDKGEMVQLECLASKLGTPGSRLGITVKRLMDKGYVPM